jgi:uncharacterized protein (UPF0548 family)
MFLARRPSGDAIARFLSDSRNLPVSYGPIGLATRDAVGPGFDEAVVAIGHGAADFARARAGLMAWAQFAIGWVEIHPPSPSIADGTVVAVLVRHLGFWSLNGCRVVYTVADSHESSRFGFAYGTLTNHAERGEELFEVFIDPASQDVFYRIRAYSRPRALLARLGYPVVRRLQARFRHDSGLAMRRTTASS